MHYYKIADLEQGVWDGSCVDTIVTNPSTWRRARDFRHEGGVHFTSKDILAFINRGSEVYELHIPEDVPVIAISQRGPQQYKVSETHFKRIGIKHLGKWSDISTLEKLLDQGAEIHAWSDRALRYAASEGYTEVVAFLLKRGASVNADSGISLLRAVEHGHTEIVRLLLEYKADVHAYNDCVFGIAAEKGSAEIVALLKGGQE